MGWGHSVPDTIAMKKRQEAYGLETKDRDSGYPMPREQVKFGRMTVNQILENVDMTNVVSYKKTGHNEVRRELQSGVIIYRLRETDIVGFSPCGTILIDTGGWNTMTTRRHIMDILSYHNFQSSLWGDKKRGGNILRIFSFQPTVGMEFKKTLIISPNGKYLADLGWGS